MIFIGQKALDIFCQITFQEAFIDFHVYQKFMSAFLPSPMSVYGHGVDSHDMIVYLETSKESVFRNYMSVSSNLAVTN